MTKQPPALPEPQRGHLQSRRGFLAASTVAAGTIVSGRALADSLADVPAREPGEDLSGLSERSPFVHISRIPEAGPGQRNVDPGDAINSKAPLDKLVGSITPADLHYERSHAGVPMLDPAQHRLLIHGMTEKQLVLTMDDIRAMPSMSRTVFIECTGNGWENWHKADETLTVQNTHGLISTNEWTGVPLSFLLDLVGVDRDALWMLAEGGDGAAVARSVPLTDEVIDEAMLAYGQNGEPLRPAHGFPLRLVLPGFEGNMNIKWLRRLKFGDRPFMTRWETDRYTQLRPDGKAEQFHLHQDVNSVITSPSGMMSIRPGYNRITGLAWSGHGKVTRVEVSTDGGASWHDAQLNGPVLAKAQTRFQMDWAWNGNPSRIVSRSTDDKGNVQPDRKSFLERVGATALFHYNAQQTWRIGADGSVRNALD
ncbi:sulfite dehydrogenase [Pelagibius sp. 7325]|uniref:sulfite dehydrogenase n=1 Tax=Pelagibius sp. 7325 TaxID=3131994 RepID=UPI0030EDAE1B